MTVEDLRQAQPKLTETFQQILEAGRLNHAYLFSGNFSSFAMALTLSQSLFCENRQGVWSCGTCRACRLIESEEFSDVTVVRPVNGIIKTERIRELVRSFSQSGMEGNRQVFIICDADKMHVNAANSLLKVIEEPQSEIYIFLLTADEHLILPTIKSRTQIFHFRKNQATLQYQLEESGLIKSQAELLAAYSQTQEEADQLASNRSFFELVSESQRFVKAALTNENQAYLQVAKLAKLVEDKDKQEQALKVLEVLLAKELGSEAGRKKLEDLLEAKKMWRANVSFQNALEYMILKASAQAR
ncbi:DNA polymerase III subunit delta' [Streptococcus cristatus]|uniref:DNA polymerase III subunit tau n=1 Tax=Streptococcus cristatus TaxID=45634 RepID=A0A3R9N172_STRCR|nr:DNA polymerase III subunit delta' [Streptococcus cristatus]RSJ94723.1 DNA polymerase III subunit tau [Streptococcus cristatus]